VSINRHTGLDFIGWHRRARQMVATLSSVHGVPAILPRDVRDAGLIILFATKFGAVVHRKDAHRGDQDQPYHYYCIEFDWRDGPRLFTAEEIRARLA